MCYRFVCCLAEPDHMWRKFGGIGRLRVRTSFVSQCVRIESLYSPLALFRCECDFAQPWLYASIRNRTWNMIDLWRLYRFLLNCSIASRAVLLDLITCDEYLAVSDVCAYASNYFRVYVLIYCTARSHFSVVNASLPSLDCITAFELHFEYDWFVKAVSMLT